MASRKLESSMVSCSYRLVIRPWAACKSCGEARRGNPSSGLLVRVEQRTAGVHAGVLGAPWSACLPADTAAALQGGVQASLLCCRSSAGRSLSARRTGIFISSRHPRAGLFAVVFQSTALAPANPVSPCKAPQATCVGNIFTQS